MTRVILLSPIWRLVTALLVVVGLGTLPTYLLSLVLLPPVPQIVMIRSFVVGTALPLAMAWGIARAFTGSLTVRNGALHLQRGDVDIDVERTASARVRPWWLPLPQPGLRLDVASGRLPFGLASRTPAAVLDALDASGIDTTAARRHPSLLFTRTRAPRWWTPLLKFVALGIVPASILFYTHQHIAYGGTFGQYYLESPQAYFRTFAEYWATTSILLISYASFWRAPAELAVWLTAAVAPSQTNLARKAAETVCALAYYAGIPILLALRYLAE